MIKKCFLLILLVWCVTARADLIHRFSFNNGDTAAIDSVGGANGTLEGAAVIQGGKVILDGTAGTYVALGQVLDEGLESVTVEVWYQDDRTNSNWSRLFDFGETSGGDGGNAMFCVPRQFGQTRFTVATNGLPSWGTGENTVTGPRRQGNYAHVACVWDGPANQIKIYVDGELQNTGDTTMSLANVSRQHAYIGASSYPGDPLMIGSVDEVRIYSTALSDEDIMSSFEAGADTTVAFGLQAYKPSPENNAEDVSIDVGQLSWTPGEYAETHNVFLGTDANVANATVDDPNGAIVFAGLDVNSVDLSRLAYGTTYYWRVDEINAPATPGTYPGSVWIFTTEPEGIALDFDNIDDVTAYTPVIVSDEQEPNMTCNESGLTNDLHSTAINTMWLGYSEDPEDPVWIQYEFDQVYKFFELLVWNYNEIFPSQDYGAKDVNVTYSIDGENWEALDSLVEFQIATGEDGYAANTVVDMNNAVAKYIRLTFLSSWTEYVYTGGLSEIRFFVIPTRATNPDPGNGENNVGMDQVLSWKPGRGAVSHKVYIGSDSNDVRDGIADMTETGDASLVIDLELAKTYYWKVDEVNEAEDYTTWDGPVWRFSTVNSIIVEDFQVGYDTADANAVWMTWSDGYFDPANGAEIGKDLSAPGLATFGHSGNASAPVSYNNTGSVAFSEVTANPSDLPIATNDWTTGSPTAFVVWFLGDANNPVTDTLYVKLNGTTFDYQGPAEDITRTAWTRFEVPLAGMNLGNITSIALGVKELNGNGSEGIVYFDDMRLMIASPEAVDPGTDSLVAQYNMENNLLDSVGGYDGEPNGVITYAQGRNGMAAVFDGNDNNFVQLPIGTLISTMESCTISTWINYDGGAVWQRVYDFGTSTTNYMFMTPDQGTTFRAVLLVDGNGEDIASAPELQTGNWEHVAAVYDAENSALKLYLNGILVATDTTMRYPVSDLGVTTQNYLGKSQWPDPNLRGMLDDFRIYDRALSDAEVKFLAQE